MPGCRFLLPQLSRSKSVRRIRGGAGLVRSEEGFTLIELMLATGTVLTGLVMLGSVMTTGLKAAGYARDRESATQLANQTVEQVRALPYNVMKVGLASNDLSGDSNITSSGCGSTTCFGGERIVAHTADPVNDKPPLVPHISSPAIHIGPSAYTVKSYVTYYCPGCADPTISDARRLTVYVSWPSALSGGGVKTVQVQTIIYSSACPPLTHPYLGPCVPSFEARATRAPATASISGTIDGVGLDHATLSTSRATSDGAIEQVWRVHGSAQASGGAIQLTGGSEQTVGGAAVSSGAASDPGSGSIYDTHTLSSPAGGTASASLGSNTVSVSTTGGDSGATTSTTSACTAGSCLSPATPSPRLCPNLPGYTNENDLLPCGGSSATSSAATTSASLGPLGLTTLAALSTQASPTIAIVDRKQLTIGSNCLAQVGGAQSDGCVLAQMSRSAETLSAGAAPAGLGSTFSLALNGGYFVRISGLTDSVSAQGGVGSSAPTATQSGLSVTYMTSVGGVPTLVTKVLADLVDVPLTVPTLTLLGTGSALGTTLEMSATVTPAATACTSNGVAASCSVSSTATRSSATATSTPPVVTITYTLTGLVNASLSIVLDPGVLSASSSYAPPTS